MTYVITANCTRDAVCVEACPVDCIHPRQDESDPEGGLLLYINPDECVDCAACEPVCPAEAIFAEDNLPEEWQPFAEINRLYYQDPAAAEAAVQAYRGGH